MTDDHGPLRLLGVEEVAKLLGTHRKEVNELIESGQLPCVRVGLSREPRVSRAMLEAWAAAVGRGERVEAPEPVRRRRRRAVAG